MRITTLVASGAAAALLLSACTGGSSSTTEQKPVSTGNLSGTITFQTWSLKGDKFSPYLTKLVTDFQAKHPGTTINWIDQPGEGYEDKVLQQANSGSLPDVVNLPDGFAAQLARVDKIVDLKKAAPDTLGAYVDGGIKAYTVGEGVYGYPWYLGTDVSWWNTTQLKEAGLTNPPATQDEYYAAAKSAAEKTQGKVKLVSSLPGVEALSSDGVKAFDGKKFTFNSPDAVAIIQKYADLYKAGAMPAEVLNNDYAGNAAMFTQGKVAYTTGTGSFVTQMTKDSPNLLPSVAVTSRLSAPPLFVQGISVAKDSKNSALAMAFAQYVTDNANQVEFVKLARGFLPGTKAANADTAALTAGVTDPLMVKAMQLAAAQMGKATVMRPVEYTDDMDKYTKAQIALAMQGKITAQEALDKAVEYCNRKL